MKRFKTEFLFTAILIALAFTLASCADDGDGESIGLPIVYMQTFRNDICTCSLEIEDGVATITRPNFMYKAYITRELSHDISFSLAQDNSLVGYYNELNGTKYVEIPDGLLNISADFTIPADSLASRQVLDFEVADPATLPRGMYEYLVPFEVAGNPADGYAASSNKGIAWLSVTAKFINTNSGVNDAPTDSSPVSDRSEWAATAPGTPFYNTGSMFDGSSTTYTGWYRSTGKEIATVDMGKEYNNITGLYFLSSSSSYRPAKMDIWTSMDGENFDFQGSPALVASATQYVTFKTPVDKARYIRFQPTSWANANYLRISEFNVYLKN